MFLPGYTFLNRPLAELLDSTLFRITSCVHSVAAGQAFVVLEAEVIGEFRLDREPYSYFGNGFQMGTRIHVELLPAENWRLQKATAIHPSGGKWMETVSQIGGEWQTKVEGTISGKTIRSYEHEVRIGPPKIIDPTQFRLEYYGLSESTAGFLQRSRRYIIAFCVVFFAAVGLRLLAIRAGRRKKSSESPA